MKTSLPLFLRKLTPSDIDDFMKWATDEEVTRWMLWNRYETRQQAELFFSNVVEKHPWFRGIVLGDEVIGSISLEKGERQHKAELGYVMAKKHWGNGYATCAIEQALAIAFEELSITRIQVTVDPMNIGSQRALEKNGFVREGLLRNFILHHGVSRDCYMYGKCR